MKWLLLYYKILGISSFIYGTTVILDTFVLNQFLKNLMVKANTSSASLYNSDGVLNMIAILFSLVVIPGIIYLILCILTGRYEKRE